MEYQENEELHDFPEFDKVYKRFQEKGILKDPTQISLYTAISNVWCVGKAVLDAGCGLGIGTHILAREALGVWGLDNNADTIKVAKLLYEGPRLKFEEVDLLEELPRPFATFDIVTCIEVIEHVKDYEKIIITLKKFHDPKRRTVFFISSPNRNSQKLGQQKPNNEYHVREWMAGEFYQILTKHFGSVVLYSGERVDTFAQEETVDGNTEETPILAKCEDPIAL
jgi:2-polyprenyl-3-methyl-5-hydroxy-6-metoxy-1,4-benzoquinol methylase